MMKTWGSDTFAHFTGVRFGEHKLAPRISPKKTVEGAVGGVLDRFDSVIFVAPVVELLRVLSENAA